MAPIWPRATPPGQPPGAEPGPGPGTEQPPGAAGEARVMVRRGGRLRALEEGSVGLLGASVLLMVLLCAWLVVAEVRLRRRRDKWRPRPPPRAGSRPSRVLLLAADANADPDEGYVQPRSLPPATLPAGPATSAPAPAPGPPRAHSYLLVVGGDPATATVAAYEEVDGIHLRPKAPGAEEGYVPMQRRRVPTVLRVVRGGAQGGELDVACDEYLFMEPQVPPTPHASAVLDCRTEKREQKYAHMYEVVPAARPLPPLPSTEGVEEPRGPT